MNSSTPPARSSGGLVLLTLLAALTVRSLWHLALAWDIAAQPDRQVAAGSAPDLWRTLDPLVGWIALLIFALSRRLARPAERRLNAADAAILLLGLAAAFTAAALAGSEWRGGAELVNAVLLGLAAILCVVREFRANTIGDARPGATSPPGLNIEQLWRLIASQWVLLWVAAELYLRLRMRGAEIMDSARALLFLLPTVGVLPNVLMAVGIRWWADLLGRPRALRPRQRAWVLALVAQNLGAALLVLAPRWLGVLGAFLLFAATVLYLVGFPAPRSFWLFAAWAFAALGWILLALERIMQSNDQVVLLHFTAAWRIALTDGWLLIWLLACGTMALRTTVIARQQMPLLTLAGGGLLALGSALLVFAWLLATADRAWIGWLLPGAAAQALGLLLTSLGALRGASLIRMSTSINGD